MSLYIKLKKTLKNFNLDIEFESENKKIGLLGVSGAGKTQILKSIAGLNELESGYIKHNDIVFYDSKNKININPQSRGVGYLFQNYALFPHMTVRKQIELTSKIKNIDDLCKNFRIDKLLDSKPSKISGGEAQRVAMVRMFATNPKIILLDEPFSALDVNLKIKLREELNEMLENFDGSVVLVSHDIDDMTEICDEIICIESGKVIAQTDINELDKNLNSNIAKLIGYHNIEIDGEKIFYNPKNFSFEKNIGDNEFMGEIIQINKSVNYDIITMEYKGKRLRAEFLKDKFKLEIGKEIKIYQNIVK